MQDLDESISLLPEKQRREAMRLKIEMDEMRIKISQWQQQIEQVAQRMKESRLRDQQRQAEA